MKSRVKPLAPASAVIACGLVGARSIPANARSATTPLDNAMAKEGLMRRWIIMATLLMALGVTGPARAADAEVCNDKSLVKIEPAKVVAACRRLADKGEAQAQTNLGWLYQNGEGVAKSDSEAARWYRKAADQGNTTAQFNLATMYENGEGVSHSHAEAAKWYRKAADQGDADAEFNLGFLYENGQGVQRNESEAARWYRKAADQGHAGAQNNLGVFYEYGRGVTQDLVAAYAWFYLAATQDKGSAARNRDDLAARMTQPQIERAKALAADWRPAIRK